MDRRLFVSSGIALIVSSGLAKAMATETPAPRLPSMGGRAVPNLPPNFRRNIRRINDASGQERKRLAMRTIREMPMSDNFLAQRFEVSRRVSDPTWRQQTAQSLFQDRRARQAFAGWIQNLETPQRDTPLTDILVYADATYTQNVMSTYVTVGMGAGYDASDLTDTVDALSGGRIRLVFDQNIDPEAEIQTRVQRDGNSITVRASNSGRGMRPLRERRRGLEKAPAHKRGVFNVLHKALTGAAAGAAVGTIIEPGGGTAVGAVVGGVIGLAAGLEDELGGGTGFWDPDGNCPPEDQPNVLC